MPGAQASAGRRAAYAFASVTTQRTATPGLGSLGSGAVTAASLAVQQGLAAVVGVLIAREFGRSAETDGFFAAYGVFIVIALVATASRAVLLPPLARARAERRLGGETAAYAMAVSLVAVPLLVLSIVGANAIATVLTGFDEGLARDTAATTLPWLVAAAVGQLYAALAASALAALDDYRTAAAGYALGSAVGLGVILWRVGEDGIAAVAWGMALNAVIATALPAAVLVRRARSEAMPRSAARPARAGHAGRIGGFAAGVALPLALQAVYLVSLPFAAREGLGAVTSLGYAYLAGAAVIGVTASSLALVTSVPLTRAGLDPVRVARHVDASAWLALVAVGATAGVFTIAGEAISAAVLGGAYGDDVGEELGRVLVALSPWMVVTIGISAAFPLVFVARRGTRLPAVALLVLAVHLPLAWAAQTFGGLYGLAGALAVSTGVGLVAVLAILHAVAPTLRGLGVAAGTIAVVAAAAFLPAGFLLGPVAAAVVGVPIYAALLLVTRPPGLRASWRYLRSLS